ncbi:unnamed protein product, partial [Bubo scandiacus]
CCRRSKDGPGAAARAKSISSSIPEGVVLAGGTVPWPQFPSLCERLRVYLYEKKSFIFANKDLL